MKLATNNKVRLQFVNSDVWRHRRRLPCEGDRQAKHAIGKPPARNDFASMQGR
jgi:hypothetical protein